MSDPTLIAGLVGAAAGSLATAIAEHMVTRPRPKVNVLRFELDPMQSDDQNAIAEDILQGKARKFFITPVSIMDAMRSSDYLHAPDPFYQHPHQFTFYLYKASRDAEMIRLLHREMPRVVSEMRGAIRVRDYQRFLQLFAYYDKPLWGQLSAAFVRQRFDLVVPSTTQAADPKHPVSVDQDGDLFVSIGRYRIPLIWTIDSVHKQRLSLFASRVANVLSNESPDGLEALMVFFEGVDWAALRLNEEAEAIAKELERFDRVVVRGIISNSGRCAVAVDGRCRIKINSRGFRYAPAVGAPEKVFPEDIDVVLRCVDSKFLRRVSSIEVPGGGATPFIAISESYLHELPAGEVVRPVLNGERTAEVTFNRLDNGRCVRSRKLAFRRY